MGKMGSICRFSRAMPASIWARCSQVLATWLLLALGAHTKGSDNDTCRAVFPSIWVSLAPPNTVKQGKTQNDKSTLFYQPTGGVFWKKGICQNLGGQPGKQELRTKNVPIGPNMCLVEVQCAHETPRRRHPNSVRDKFLHRGYCTSGTRIWGRILPNEFWTPEFWTPVLGSNCFILFFPAKEACPKIHPPEIHLPKFTFQNSTQKSGQKNHIAPLQGRC